MQTPGLLVGGAGVSQETVQRTVGYAKAAEQRGFHSCLVAEAASDALSLAQHVASITSRIQVGTAITNIFLRPPLLAALQALTINAAAPGRLFLGLGTSHGMVNQVYGLPREDEAYYVVKGTGKITVEDRTQEVTEGDLVSVPREVRHHVHDYEELVLLVFFAPAFTQSC